MGDKITALPPATSLDGTEVSPIVQAGTTKKVAGTILRSPIGNAGGDLTGSYPNPTLAAITTAQSAGTSTAIPVLSVDAKGRVTSLSTVPNPQGTVTNVTAGTGLSGGPITSTGTLSVNYGTTEGTATQGNDTRFSTIPDPSETLPYANAAAAIGTSQSYARADHVHPQGSVTLSGDITGTGTNSIVGTLASIVTPQSNIGGITQIPQISIDAKGRVTNLVAISNPQTAITGLTGDVSANGPGVVSASLSVSGVTAGSYGYASTGKIPTFTVDAKGRIGSASEATIVLPTEQTSLSSNTLLFGSKTFVFTSPSSSIPYFALQWITIRSTTSGNWISGTVSSCTVNQVVVNVLQSSSPIGSTSYASWQIKLGQTINQIGTPTVNQVLGFVSPGVWSPITLPAPSTDATALQGYAISTAAPITGQNLVWSGSAWAPQSGASANAISIQSVNVDATAPVTDDVLLFDGTNWAPTNLDVGNAVKLQSRDVASTLPTDGQVLAWDDAASTWKPVAASAGGSDATSLQGDAIADVIPNALEVLTWAKEPAGTGDFEWRPRPLTGNSTPTAGQTLVYDASSGWIAGNVAQLQGQPITATAPSSGNILLFDGTSWAPFDGIAIPNWNSGAFYAPGDFVYYQNQFWVCQSNNTGNTPTLSSPNGTWTPITGANATASTPSDGVNIAGWIATVIGGTAVRIPYYV